MPTTINPKSYGDVSNRDLLPLIAGFEKQAKYTNVCMQRAQSSLIHMHTLTRMYKLHPRTHPRTHPPTHTRLDLLAGT